MNAVFEIHLYHPNRPELLAVIDNFDSLQYVRMVNGPGTFSIRIPAGLVPSSLVREGARVTIYREPSDWKKELEYGGLIDYFNFYSLQGKATMADIKGMCYTGVLERRIVAYKSTTPETRKEGPADDVVKEIVRENLGGDAHVTRDITGYGFQVEENQGAATGIYKTFPFKNVLTVCQEITEQSLAEIGTALFFRVEPLGWHMEFRTRAGKWGKDHRWPNGAQGPILFSVEGGHLRDPSLTEDWEDENNYIYVAGQDEGVNRMLVEISDQARVAHSSLARRERFYDGRNYPLESQLEEIGRELLHAHRPQSLLQFTLLESPEFMYRRHWDLGDMVSASFRGVNKDYWVIGVKVTVNSGEQEIEPILMEILP